MDVCLKALMTSGVGWGWYMSFTDAAAGDPLSRAPGCFLEASAYCLRLSIMQSG